MNTVSLNLHTARGIRARRICINGQWQLHITVELEDDAQTSFAIYADTREALEVVWAPNDEHCRITGQDSHIEYSDKPFGSPPSASTGSNQE